MDRHNMFKLTLVIMALLLPAHLLCMASEAPAAAAPGTPTVDTPKVETPQAGTSSGTYAFQADVSKIMDIIIHSLYSHKDIFLRELVSNASDALDKIRYFGLSNPEKYGNVADMKLQINVVANKEANTLTITDTGVGMTREQLISELGTVARSGTSSFIEAFEQNADVSLIGQFGVGFYSVYLVADTVTVYSKHPDSDTQWVWESSADQTFHIAESTDADEKLVRGTKIVLHMREDSAEYLDASKIRDVLKKHSQFINYPIYLEVEKEVEVTIEETDDATEPAKEDNADTDAVVEESSSEEPEKKTRKEKVREDELVNDLKPIWLRPASDVSEDDYNNFYKALTKDAQVPSTHIHFNAEGEVEFKSILYAPKKAPFDAYQDYNKKKGTVSLYVRRVLITDEFDELLPNYLGFIRGVVDSDSLPLNVNREMLQQNKVLKVIGKKLVRKSIAMLQQFANKHKKSEDTDTDTDTDTNTDTDANKAEDNEDYLEFFKQFGKFLKLGVAEDRSNQARLAKLLRFPSTLNPNGFTSLEAYVGRMKDDQKAIYYIAGDNLEALQKHPTIEKLAKKGYEVFLLADPLDEHCLQSLAEFQSHKITDTSRATLKFDESVDEKKKQDAIEKHYTPLTKWLKDILGNEVEKVVVSKRLETSPGAVVAGDYGWTANMERIMTSQVFTNTDNMGYMKSRKTFEVNPSHPVVKSLLEVAKKYADVTDGEESADLKTAKDSAVLLYQTCLINSGFSLPATSSSEFSARLERLIRGGLGVSLDEPIAEPEVDLSAQDAQEEPAAPASGDDDAEEVVLDAAAGHDEL
eukprot:c9934_g1_i1.p1 GENE.c9934_g1_i1~~c9934_g1_i1.p1  ORF type:complete len:809 (+),score=257.94 c9934_g1_i1:53-2479(+)